MDFEEELILSQAELILKNPKKEEELKEDFIFRHIIEIIFMDGGKLIIQVKSKFLHLY